MGTAGDGRFEADGVRSAFDVGEQVGHRLALVRGLRVARGHPCVVASVPATFASYGNGCAGPAGVPSLGAVAGSLPHIGSTPQLRLSNLPPAFVNVPIGFVGFDATSWNGIPLPVSLTPLGFTGCDALLAPVRSDGLTNTNGIANWNVALPMNALALGIDVYFQGAVLVPGWNPAGFVFSNGGHAVVGSPGSRRSQAQLADARAVLAARGRHRWCGRWPRSDRPSESGERRTQRMALRSAVSGARRRRAVPGSRSARRSLPW